MQRRTSGLCFVVVVMMACVFADGASVRGRFSIGDQSGVSSSGPQAGAVVWLVPLSPQADLPVKNSNSPLRHLTLVQKDKRFDPHVLVVEVGTVVDFPNRDPFFHNVFSLFDGKRFDLGLYEAGSTRGVRFDRPGVCYIFCNIHAEMSAVVVVVNTPYFAVSNRSGEFEIPEVPAGRYRLNVWAERCLPKTLTELSREVTVGSDTAVLGTIHLEKSREVVTVHRNKYGKDYDPQVFSSPAYIQP
jgi:plastocyanin